MKRRGFLKGLIAGSAVAATPVVLQKDTKSKEEMEEVKVKKFKKPTIVIDEDVLPDYYWDKKSGDLFKKVT